MTSPRYWAIAFNCSNCAEPHMNAIESHERSLQTGPRELAITTQNGEPDHVVVAVRDFGSCLDPKSSERIFRLSIRPSRAGMAWAIDQPIDCPGSRGRLAERTTAPGTSSNHRSQVQVKSSSVGRARRIKLAPAAPRRPAVGLRQIPATRGHREKAGAEPQ